jgi:hypothetical protein
MPYNAKVYIAIIPVVPKNKTTNINAPLEVLHPPLKNSPTNNFFVLNFATLDSADDRS